MKKEEKLSRELKRLSNKILGTNYPLNSTNIQNEVAQNSAFRKAVKNEVHRDIT